ncbi:MAG: hypothetical protein RL094_343 [Candidatus Parcubacteria bacterium]|jgi:hypothetical protein
MKIHLHLKSENSNIVDSMLPAARRDTKHYSGRAGDVVLADATASPFA